MRYHNLLALALVMTVLPVGRLEGDNKRVRIERAEIIGSWTGLTTDELQMIRLTLASAGQGSIGFSFVDEAPCVFRLTSWTFEKGEITLELDGSSATCPLDRGFHGVVRGNALELTVSGSGWKRRASLRKEHPLVERWQKLVAAMSPSN